jgi:Raf kinase inhibitor-like YbhB/YbcL family protein
MVWFNEASGGKVPVPWWPGIIVTVMAAASVLYPGVRHAESAATALGLRRSGPALSSLRPPATPASLDGSAGQPRKEASMMDPLTLTSPDFPNGGPIPQRCTCEGQDLPPRLVWQGVPEQARSLVLIVDDPDAPDPAAPQRVWVHWVLYDMPSSVRKLPAQGGDRAVPAGTRQGKNDWDRTGYGGPCPPTGRHRYFFKLYALDTVLGDLQAPTKGKVEQAMHQHVIANATLMGTYQKEGR